MLYIMYNPGGTNVEIKIMSVFGAFEYVMNHYAPYFFEEELLFKDSFAVISIQDAHSDGFGFEFKQSKYCKGVLTLKFDDVYKKVKNTTPFNKEMANQIIDFLDEYDGKVDTLLIHCYAGESRSRAVGAFAKYFIGEDNAELIEFGSPNLFVYELLMKEYKKRLSN